MSKIFPFQSMKLEKHDILSVLQKLKILYISEYRNVLLGNRDEKPPEIFFGNIWTKISKSERSQTHTHTERKRKGSGTLLIL